MKADPEKYFYLIRHIISRTGVPHHVDRADLFQEMAMDLNSQLKSLEIKGIYAKNSFLYKRLRQKQFRFIHRENKRSHDNYNSNEYYNSLHTGYETDPAYICEIKDFVEMIKSQVSDIEWKILKYKAMDGYTYEEISQKYTFL